jgi:hypothetical protein
MGGIDRLFAGSALLLVKACLKKRPSRREKIAGWRIGQ